MKQVILNLTAALLMLLASVTVKAQEETGTGSPRPMTKAEQEQIISALVKQLNDNYVFPDVAKKAEKKLREQQKKGLYEKITERQEFATALSDQLAETVNDKHLRVWYNVGRKAPHRRDATADSEHEAAFMRHMRRQNLGLPKLDILEGNIGYLKVDGFGPVDRVGETMSGAMTYLSNTDALIIDLRENHGGEPSLVQYFVSHFFDGEPIHINDLYFRPSNRTEEFWTVPVKGVKYLNKPVYILTSGTTFSGGEEFAYDMQQLKRATLVGETTGGGANPGEVAELGSGFEAFIPTGRAINPVTKTNWEGVGVKPHVATTAANALKEAHILALTEVLNNAKDEGLKKYYQSNLDKIQKK